MPSAGYRDRTGSLHSKSQGSIPSPPRRRIANMPLSALVLGLALSQLAAEIRPVSIVPYPASLVHHEGVFRIVPDTVIQAFGDAHPTGRQLRGYLSPATGYRLPVEPAGDPKPGSIRMQLDPAMARLGDEGYRLVVRPDYIDLRASTATGLFYGVQTLRQLLPPAIFRQARVEGVAWEVPCVEIEDYPRFRWRGLMMDSCRHFMPKEFVKKTIDLLALHKMNVFHWHLTEDQGWRLEIKRYPRLTEIGAWRKETIVGHGGNPNPTFDGIPHGGYYTQDDAREIVAYAAERHIMVVPEIEMPGHAQAAIAAYPELGNTGERLEVWTRWGVNENVFNVEESTIQFLQNVLEEVLDIFPSPFIHIGGDEVPKKQWQESPRAQARMRELGLNDEHELQSWFIRRMDTFLTERGRRLIGWDEILEGGLAPGATVMSWRGTAGGIAAAKMGHDVVMSPTSHLYFDYYQSRDRASEPLAIGGFLPLSRVYEYEPIPSELNAEEAKRVLGAQGNVWTEYIKNPKQFEYMAFPRTCALAEVVWTPATGRDYDRFLSALKTHLQRLQILDVNFRPLDRDTPPVARWSPDRLSEEFTTLEWDITTGISGPGDYTVLFQYVGGAHRLDIAWAELVGDGRSLGRVEQPGRTGTWDENNRYAFRIAEPAPRQILLRASVRSDGGTDSHGEIFVHRT